MPLASISTLVRLPNWVPLVVIDCVLDVLSSWVRPPEPPEPPARLSVMLWAAMPREDDQATWPAPGVLPEAPRLMEGLAALKIVVFAGSIWPVDVNEIMPVAIWPLERPEPSVTSEAGTATS